MSPIIETDDGSLLPENILNDWGPSMLGCGERAGRGCDTFDTMARRIRNAIFVDVHDKITNGLLGRGLETRDKRCRHHQFPALDQWDRGLVHVVAHQVWSPATLGQR